MEDCLIPFCQHPDTPLFHSPISSLRTDVLIIGAGAAGIRAAAAAAAEGADVLVVHNGSIGKSGSTFSALSGGWGIQALVGKERTEKNLEAFYDEIIEAGLGMCDPKLVRVLVEESGPRVEDLMSWGVSFKKNPQGKHIRVKGCFSEVERAFITEDPANIRQVFLSLLRHSNAKIMAGYAAELITDSCGVCRGAWVIDSSDEIVRIDAGATILATGGGAGLFSDHFVTDFEAGDGYAIAHRAGGELKNLEFIQFVIGVKRGSSTGFLPTGALNQAGMLSDSEAKDILASFIPEQSLRNRAVAERMKHVPFSSRDDSRLVDLAVATAKRQRKNVYWPADGDMAKKLEVAHFSHAFNGGVKIDEKAESSVPGLFAAGEVAAGPHGADRIGGCMMTATQVFGERAGKFAARHARSFRSLNSNAPVHEPLRGFTDRQSPGKGEEELAKALVEAREVFSHHLMILRNESGLISCLGKIREAQTQTGASKNIRPRVVLRARNMLLLMEQICTVSLARGASCGPHFREDAAV